VLAWRDAHVFHALQARENRLVGDGRDHLHLCTLLRSGVLFDDAQGDRQIGFQQLLSAHHDLIFLAIELRSKTARNFFDMLDDLRKVAWFLKFRLAFLVNPAWDE
jgi:hypothetical protein